METFEKSGYTPSNPSSANSIPNFAPTEMQNGNNRSNIENMGNHQSHSADHDIEARSAQTSINEKVSAFKGLGWLDRYLALWIFLCMAVGILLGNFVPQTGPALQRGEFVGVSIPLSVSVFSNALRSH